MGRHLLEYGSDPALCGPPSFAFAVYQPDAVDVPCRGFPGRDGRAMAFRRTHRAGDICFEKRLERLPASSFRDAAEKTLWQAVYKTDADVRTRNDPSVGKKSYACPPFRRDTGVHHGAVG